MMKKLLIITILVSLLSSIPNAFAVSAEVTAANYIATQGIINDNSANPEGYRLSDTITRKEAVKIVMKLSGYQVPDKCDGKFSDVINDWGCKYIEAALENDFIAGNDTYRPDDNVTKTEAMKLVFKARGIEKTFSTSNWQKDYMDTAYAKGLIDTKYTDFDTDATRGWIFVLAQRAFDYTKDFKIISPKVNPFSTIDSIVVIEGMVPGDFVNHITVNDYQLQEFEANGTEWKYHANAAYGNLSYGKNTYVIKYFNADYKLLLKHKIIINRNNLDKMPNKEDNLMSDEI